MTRQQTRYYEGVGGAAVEYEGANETVVATVTGVNTDVGSRQVNLIAQAYFTTAAETAKTTLKIRRGTTTTGTLIGECTIEGVAAKQNECSFQVTDTQQGELAQASYVLTLTESKAGSKPKSVESRLRAEV